MTFIFNKGYEEIRKTGEAAIAKSGLPDKDVQWLLDMLRKTGTMDMVSEFLKGIDRNSDRVLDDGYLNAIGDFMAFVNSKNDVPNN